MNDNKLNNQDVKTNIIASFIGISISVFVVMLVFVFNKSTHINIKNIWDFDYTFFYFALFLFVLSVSVNAFRVFIMAKFMKVKIPFLKSLIAVFMGMYVSNITPSAIGGQPYQIYLMSQYGIETGISTTIVVSQFFTTNLFNLIVDILFFPYLIHFSGMAYMWFPFIFGFSIFLFMMVSIFVLSFNRKILTNLMDFFFRIKMVRWFYRILKKDPEKEKRDAFEQLNSFHDSTIKVWSSKKIALVIDFVLASVSRILMFAIPYVFYLSFFTNKIPSLSFYDFVTVQIVVMHAAYLLPTPGSSGGFETIFLYLFSSKINPKILSMVVFGWRFATYYFVIILGTIINIFTSIKQSKKASKEA